MDPHPSDVLILLANFHKSSIRIPLNILVDIFGIAGFIPTISKLVTTSFISEQNANTLYLSVPLQPMVYFEPKLIKYIVNSKDQGWSSYPNQKGSRTSNTWGEAAISTLPELRNKIFVNIHAGQVFEKHTTIYSRDDSFCTALNLALENIKSVESSVFSSSQGTAFKSGTTVNVELWLRSMYPAWKLHCNYALIEVSYGLINNWENLIKRQCDMMSIKMLS